MTNIEVFYGVISLSSKYDLVLKNNYVKLEVLLIKWLIDERKFHK